MICCLHCCFQKDSNSALNKEEKECACSISLPRTLKRVVQKSLQLDRSAGKVNPKGRKTPQERSEPGNRVSRSAAVPSAAGSFPGSCFFPVTRASRTVPGIELHPRRSDSRRTWPPRQAGEKDRGRPSLPRKLRGLAAPA
jgi:hypothetical protein